MTDTVALRFQPTSSPIVVVPKSRRGSSARFSSASRRVTSFSRSASQTSLPRNELDIGFDEFKDLLQAMMKTVYNQYEFGKVRSLRPPGVTDVA